MRTLNVKKVKKNLDSNFAKLEIINIVNNKSAKDFMAIGLSQK